MMTKKEYPPEYFDAVPAKLSSLHSFLVSLHERRYGHNKFPTFLGNPVGLDYGSRTSRAF
jgi:hypothetical protein